MEAHEKVTPEILAALEFAQVELIRWVRRAFDPNNIPNSGKIVSEAIS